MNSQLASARITPSEPADTKRPTILAGEVGITLMVSDKARRELERIQDEFIMAAQDYQKFYWR